jgi:hypothetical protein
MGLNMLRFAFVVALGAVVSCASDGQGGNDKDAGPMERVLAQDGIAITGVAHFQGMKIPIMIDGAVNDKASRAYAVAGKASLFRVYIAHDNNWKTRPLECVLDITLGDGTKKSFTAMVPDVTKSSDDAMSSTVNFDLPGELMTADATYSLRIVEVGKMGPPSTGPLDSRWPVDGTATSLDAHYSGDQVKLTLVPIRYNGDGSGRLPYTNQVQIDEYQHLLEDTYPTPAFAITMHAVVNYSGQVLANGQGWDSLLAFIANMRQSEKAAPDVYYYGIFEPAASLQAYCGGGCVEGLALEGTMPMDTYSRAAVGVGFPDPTSDTTMLQELAHNMGRLHAPCGGPQNVDKAYPYPGGSTGVWGWSLSQKMLFPPDMNKDFMSYCQPQWVSDYTYRGLFDRIALVNGASIKPGPVRSFRWATYDGANITWGARFTDTTPLSDVTTVGGVTGHYYPYDHLPGGLLIVPEP